MRKRNAMFLAPLVVGGASLLVGWGGAASAGGSRTGGAIHIYEADTSLAGTTGTVIITGAITDYSTDLQGVPQDGTNKVVLTRGSFSVDVNGLGNALAQLPVNTNTCSSDGSVTGSIQIVPGSGAGAYRGISGPFTSTVSTAYIVSPQTSGCNPSGPSPAGILIGEGSGTVSYK